jgi:hypothetical protein
MRIRAKRSNDRTLLLDQLGRIRVGQLDYLSVVAGPSPDLILEIGHLCQPHRIVPFDGAGADDEQIHVAVRVSVSPRG